jgi:diguanylate cyclase (GGDEF)-like protein
MHNRDLSLLLVDIDEFAAYNQTYGFAAGDDVLKAVVTATRAAAQRPGDTVGRVSGNRLAVLLPETAAAQATGVADQINQAVRSLGLRHGKSSAADVVTVSLGVVTATRPTSAAELMTAAENALQTAKLTGRNRVNTATPL